MSPLRDKIFYSICFGFVFGVFLRTFIFIELYSTILFLIISFFILLFLFISRSSSPGGRFSKWGKITGFFILAICLGILRFNVFDVANPKNFESKVGHKIEIEGIISDDVETKENNQKFILSPRNVPGERQVKVSVSALFTEEYKYGDIVSVTGKLEKPENFITDYGKEFDYVNYLKKDGILYTMSFPEIEVISHNNGNKLKSILFNIKEKFIDKINFSIKEPENLLMGGLILGEKAAFDQTLRENFIKTGTIHIVALSGYNITIIAEWIIKIFSFLPINFSIGFGIVSIFLFVLMTGGSSTAIRAGIMATLSLFARATGRNYDVARALILAGVFMIFFNPLILVYDISFQLSFIATVAVIFIAPRIEKYFTFITKKFELRGIFSVTCAAYFFVLPFILYKMGTFSLVAFPTNILILPFIPFTMMLGFLTGAAGFISSVLALPFALLSYCFLSYELFIVKIFASFSFAVFHIPSFPLFFTILIYSYFIYRFFGKDIENFFMTTPQ